MLEIFATLFSQNLDLDDRRETKGREARWKKLILGFYGSDKKPSQNASEYFKTFSLKNPVQRQSAPVLEEAVVSLQDEALSGPEESQKAEPDKRTPTEVRAMVPKKYPARLGQKPGCFREANDDEYIRKLQPLSQANTHWPNYFVPLSKVTLPRGNQGLALCGHEIAQECYFEWHCQYQRSNSHPEWFPWRSKCDLPDERGGGGGGMRKNANAFKRLSNAFKRSPNAFERVLICSPFIFSLERSQIWNVLIYWKQQEKTTRKENGPLVLGQFVPLSVSCLIISTTECVSRFGTTHPLCESVYPFHSHAERLRIRTRAMLPFYLPSLLAWHWHCPRGWGAGTPYEKVGDARRKFLFWPLRGTKKDVVQAFCHP